MSIDSELELWREQWQSATAVPPDLRRRVERQSRFMKIMLAADVLVTVVIGGGTAAWAVRSPAPDTLLLAVFTWLFIGAAWMFSRHANRGNWSPAAIHTAAFVDLSIRRCRGRLASLQFGACLYVCEMAFCLGWIYHHAGPDRKPLVTWLLFSSTFIDMVWLGSAAFFAFLFWYRRKKRAELAYLLRLQLG